MMLVMSVHISCHCGIAQNIINFGLIQPMLGVRKYSILFSVMIRLHGCLVDFMAHLPNYWLLLVFAGYC